MLKPIETVYDGYRFRSRLEARWAVFFTTLGVRYQYEPEGYVLDDVWYLPDFYLPDLNCWVEIKPVQPTAEERRKAELLVVGSRTPVFVLYGELKPPKIIVKSFGDTEFWGVKGEAFIPADNVEGGVDHDDGRWYFTECPRCDRIGMSFDGNPSDIKCGCDWSEFRGKYYGYNSTPRLVEAYTAARQARF